MLNVAQLTCFACSATYRSDHWIGVCDRCGKTLRVDYQGAPTPGGVSSLWRYDAVLPVRAEQAVSLGEGWTPLFDISDNVWIKDEADNPTGSFKDRGMSVAVSAASALAATGLAAPSAGNAAESLAHYGAAAGLPVLVAMPEDTPPAFVEACRSRAAEVKLISGTISDAGMWLSENMGSGDVNLSTLREPYRLEGKKTLAYELYEQMREELPDVVVFPTGGGTGIVGMWKAFSEMQQWGWIDKPWPRLVLVQSAGCAPIVHAFEAGQHETVPWAEPKAGPHGLRVPDPFGGSLCLRALSETSGTAVAIPDADFYATADSLASVTGLDVCPEGGGAWAAYQSLRESGWISASDKVVVFNTGAGHKYR